jgi:excisionase family DNA binding protein
MIRRNRRPDWRRIKTLRSYTIQEAADTLRVHRNAVRHWIKKCGLPALADRRPHLIRGADLIEFLKGRRAARRTKCGSGQLFCLKCRLPRSPAAGLVEYRASAAGRGSLIGICTVCETIMRRFVSKDRADAILAEFSASPARGQESLVDSARPALNCHLNTTD